MIYLMMNMLLPPPEGFESKKAKVQEQLHNSGLVPSGTLSTDAQDGMMHAATRSPTVVAAAEGAWVTEQGLGV